MNELRKYKLIAGASGALPGMLWVYTSFAQAYLELPDHIMKLLGTMLIVATLVWFLILAALQIIVEKNGLVYDPEKRGLKRLILFETIFIVVAITVFLLTKI